MKLNHINRLINTAYIEKLKIECDLTGQNGLDEIVEQRLLCDYATFQLVELELRKILKETQSIVENIEFYFNAPSYQDTYEIIQKIEEGITHQYKGLPKKISKRVKDFGKTYISIQQKNHELETKVLETKKNGQFGSYKISEDESKLVVREDMSNLYKLFDVNDQIIVKSLDDYEFDYEQICLFLKAKQFDKIIEMVK